MSPARLNGPREDARTQMDRRQWTLDNIYTMARRELHRLQPIAVQSLAIERWGHVLRLCEQVGCRSRGVLRDNGGSVLDGPASGAPAATLDELHTTAESTGVSLWQPMATAPTDGTLVLVFDEGAIVIASYLDSADEAQSGWYENGRMDTPPQYWMPLPAPPETEKS